MTKRSKELEKVGFSKDEKYTLERAVELLQKCPKVKFDQSVGLAVKVFIDPKKPDQASVKGSAILPNGTGKKSVIAVIAKGDKAIEAKESGADFVGDDDLVEKIRDGWTDFSVLITTPDMMREVGKLGKVLGPRGLMPTPKTGTVTVDIKKAIEETKGGKVDFKVDKSGVINSIIGKISFSATAIVENANTLLQAIFKAKPASSKGIFIESIVVSSTMGPGLKIDQQTLKS